MFTPAFVCGSLAVAIAQIVSASPPYQLFSAPLPVAQVAQPVSVQQANGRTIEFYELFIQNYAKLVYPNLGPAHLTGYNGTSPGPTFRITQGVETVVRVANQADRPSAMHLHGSDTHAVWDGWADDLIQPGQFKDYYYGNNQNARPLFYHDHVKRETAHDVYYGQSGIYIISDPAESSLGLPTGKYDVPLSISDKTYSSNGDLVAPDGSTINFFGDTIQVNEQPWPYLNCEPRKYRFRVYDISLSRPYDLYFQVLNADGSNATVMPFEVIGGDGGLFQAPITTNDVAISMGERYELLVDFAPYQGKSIVLMNGLQIPFVSGANANNTNKVMKFIVGLSTTDSSNNGNPSSLASSVAFPPKRTTIDHSFNFQMGGEDVWTINGVDFNDVQNRVLARPPQGTVELWQLRHTGGAGVHPVHIHLVDFQVISRTGGQRGLAPYEAAGLKDVVLLTPGETVLVNAIYGPWNGMYMFHCHNLVHEDNLMLDAFNVTRLAQLGYNSTAGLGDPADPRYVARASNASAYQPNAISSTIQALASLNAYAPESSVAAAETAYYATAGYRGDGTTATATVTAAPVSSGVGFPTRGTRPTSTALFGPRDASNQEDPQAAARLYEMEWVA